jgi:hypothetical protein
MDWNWASFQLGEKLVELLIKVFGAGLPERWKMPNIVCGDPRNMASESSLTWWHIPVWAERAYGWQATSIGPCSAAFQIESPFSARTRLKMLWSSLGTPMEFVTLYCDNNEASNVIIVARSEEEITLTGSPLGLPSFPLPARVSRMTDDHALVHTTRFTDLAPGTSYQVTLVILVAGRPYHSQLFRLYIPRTDEGNERFVFARATTAVQKSR